MIPLSTPSIIGNEWKYIKECLDTEWVSSAGKYVDLFEQKIASFTNSKFAVSCINGTSALQVSLRLLGVQQGDEVIVPTITFIAPINAVRYNGAEPVFMDSDIYYNIDVDKTISFIKSYTIYKNGFTYNKNTGNKISALIPVHVWGNACRLDELLPLCKERNIAVLEDASESLGSIYNHGIFKGMHTGTVGEIGCLSFNGNKIITTGGGGMILTNDKTLAEKAKYLTTQAKDDKINFIHNEIGYNFRMTNIQAALGVAQLEQLSRFMQKKKNIYNTYKKYIEEIPSLIIGDVPDYANNNHWMTPMRIKDNFGMDKESLFQYLFENGVETRPVWHLNHMQKPFKKFYNYKITEAFNMINETLNLPCSVNILEDDINRIVTLLKNA